MKVNLKAIRERLEISQSNSTYGNITAQLVETDLPALLFLVERMARLLSVVANEADWAGPVQRRAKEIEALLAEIEGWEGGEDGND